MTRSRRRKEEREEGESERVRGLETCAAGKKTIDDKKRENK